MRVTLIFLGLVVLGFSSCEKPQDYSPIPEIEYISTVFTQNVDQNITEATISFSFIDGDGDLGLEQADTMGQFAPDQEFYYNLIFDFYEKKNDTLKLSPRKDYFRFQNISKSQTTNKVLKGDMEVTINFENSQSFSDTSIFRFYIYDRALNKSNVVETHEIYLNE